jgi:hypothetical protein
MNPSPNRLSNGQFLHNLDNWRANDAVYSAGDGGDNYGVAVIAPGGSITQDFAVMFARRHTLHLTVKPAGSDLAAGQATAGLTDSNGNQVATLDMSGEGDTWTENTFSLGLAPGTTYTLTLTNAGAAGVISLDDVWLWPVQKTRAELAGMVHAKLGGLATDQGLSAAAAGALTEGDYTYAVEAGLRAVGAVDPESGLPDTRWLDSNSLTTALDLIEQEMLERLQRDYAVVVDLSIGPRRESLSQIGAAIGKLTGTEGGKSAGTGQVVVRALRYEADDYNL